MSSQNLSCAFLFVLCIYTFMFVLCCICVCYVHRGRRMDTHLCVCTWRSEESIRWLLPLPSKSLETGRPTEKLITRQGLPGPAPHLPLSTPLPPASATSAQGWGYTHAPLCHTFYMGFGHLNSGSSAFMAGSLLIQSSAFSSNVNYCFG